MEKLMIIKQFTFESWSNNQVIFAVTDKWFDRLDELAEAAKYVIAHCQRYDQNSYGARLFLKDEFNMHKATGVVLVSIDCDQDIIELVEHRTKALAELPEEITPPEG